MGVSGRLIGQEHPVAAGRLGPVQRLVGAVDRVAERFASVAHCQAGGDCGTCHPTIEDIIEASLECPVAIGVLRAAAA